MFGQDCAVVGMVHARALPGSPGWVPGSMGDVLAAATSDAVALRDAGVHALIVENMGDLPYLRGRVAAETVAAMALVTRAVVEAGLPTGVQILAGANREALGVAVATGASFVRVEGFAYAHVADEGWLDACAGDLLRVRAALGAEVQVWADIQKKHASHAVTSDLSLEEIAHGTAFSGADVLVVTGSRTGSSTSVADVEAACLAGLPVVVGSGVSPGQVADLAVHARALIVGSWLKRDGHWRNPVDPARVRALLAALGS